MHARITLLQGYTGTRRCPPRERVGAPMRSAAPTWMFTVGVGVGLGALLATRRLFLRYRRAKALARCISLDDFQSAAREHLDLPLYEYLASGTADEQTLFENVAAWKRYFLRPRMMRNVSCVSTATTLFGQKMEMPIFISPAGVHRLCDPEGECASARAADAVGSLFGLSQHATCSIEEVAAAAPGARRWFQAYILQDRSLTLKLVRRAEVAGYSGLFLTVDSVVFGAREADVRNGFGGLPAHLRLANYDTDDGWKNEAEGGAWDQKTETLLAKAVTWEDVAWLKQAAPNLPLVVKGILTAEDATCALDAGADGVCVSNHGGRQLDGALASIDALEEVVRAVRAHSRGASACVLLDSGVRRGTDVLKALALGATAVGIGKPCFFALAIGGRAGVERALGILKTELEAAMALCGCASVADISRTLVEHRPHHAEYTRRPL